MQPCPRYQQSYLRITLLCLDGDKIPKACECEKNVDFWYRYNTLVTAVAELRHPTTGSKNSIAQAEDMAISSFWEEFNPASFQMIKMLRAEAESHCYREPNPAFWTNGFQLLANGAAIAAAILGATQGQDSTYSAQELAQIASLIQSFFETAGAVITTPYHNPTNCDPIDEKDDNIDGSISKTLKPNSPIVFAINSFSKLYAGGRRAWIRTIDVGGIPSTTSLNCIEMPDGDSLVGEWSSSCLIDGNPYAQMVNGKFLSPSHLRLKMRYVRDTSDAEREFGIVKDSCIIDLEDK